MKFTVKKKRVIISVIVSLIMLIGIIITRSIFLEQDYEYGSVLFFVTILVILVIGLMIGVRVEFSARNSMILNSVLFFLTPIVSMQMVESLNCVFIYDFSPRSFIGNYVIYIMLYLLMYIITSSYRLAVLILNPIFLVFGIINYFIETFRGSPFVPMDLLSIDTGASVASTYTYSLSIYIAVSVVLFIFIMTAGFKMTTPKFTFKTKAIIKIICAVFISSILLIFYTTDKVAQLGIKPDFWSQLRGYRKSGAMLNFCVNTKYMFVTKPEGYDSSNIDSIVNHTIEQNTDLNILNTDNSSAANSDSTNITLPNIICVMNESFSDLSVIGDFETNEDYMPFTRSLTKNTIKGNLYVPANGAGTSNTEYEFLSGNSLSFLPSGASVYESYIKNQSATLVSTLESQGYSSLAFHPYYADGWKRSTVYPLFGFDDFMSIESFIDQSILDRYKQSNYNITLFQGLLARNYPDEDMLIRRYVSDSYDYKKLIQKYEERDSNTPFFAFNVTMQNHGGYSIRYSNFKQEIDLTSTDTYYPLTEQYLSLIKESDTSFKELITYFSKQKEPTIICMFGDHQPYIENGFFKDLFNSSSLTDLTTTQQQKRYITPFVIWANYDIPEATLDMISSNYLSTLLLQTANLKTTQYNDYLASLYKTLPVIDTVGYIDSKGNYYDYEQDSKYKTLLNEYEQVQYNNMFDNQNKDTSLFYLH